MYQIITIFASATATDNNNRILPLTGPETFGVFRMVNIRVKLDF